MVREALESLYTDTCTVTEYVEQKAAGSSITKHVETVVLTNKACRLSFKAIYPSTSSEVGSTIQQSIKIFIAPEVTIKPGSKVSVTREGVTTAYKSSGKPAMYSTHQEILLELFKGWA